MRTHYSARLAGTRLAVVTLVGLLALDARRVAAQDTTAGLVQDTSAGAVTDTTPMTLVVAVFPGPSGAAQAMGDMKTAHRTDHFQSYAVVSKDSKGKVNVQQKQGKKGAAANSTSTKAIDGAIALLGHPAQTALTPSDSSTGKKAGISAADAEKIGAILAPGSSAIVFVVADEYLDDMDSAMQQAHAKQVLDAKLQPQR